VKLEAKANASRPAQTSSSLCELILASDLAWLSRWFTSVFAWVTPLPECAASPAHRAVTPVSVSNTAVPASAGARPIPLTLARPGIGTKRRRGQHRWCYKARASTPLPQSAISRTLGRFWRAAEGPARPSLLWRARTFQRHRSFSMPLCCSTAARQEPRAAPPGSSTAQRRRVSHLGPSSLLAQPASPPTLEPERSPSLRGQPASEVHDPTSAAARWAGQPGWGDLKRLERRWRGPPPRCPAQHGGWIHPVHAEKDLTKTGSSATSLSPS